MGVTRHTAPVMIVLLCAGLTAAADRSNSGAVLAPDAPIGQHVITPPEEHRGPSMLYAPAQQDDPALRAAISAITGGTVDYFDPRVATPDVGLLTSYACVHTYTDFTYFDNVAFGDNLADAVDAGTTVGLGVFTTYTIGNFLDGRIMTPGYAPVWSPTGSNHFLWSDYAGDGTSPIHDGVTAYGCTYRDILAPQGPGIQDGSYLDGEIAAAFRPDFKVNYINGSGNAALGCTGDWALLVANSCMAGSGTGESVLYGVTHNGSIGPSDLHIVDPATGGTTLVGPITGFLGCSGMDINAAGDMFAVCERQADGLSVLISIDPSTGAGIEIGPTGLNYAVTDISFRNSDGRLFAFDAVNDPEHTLAWIDTVTGAATIVGDTGLAGSGGNGLAFSPADELFHNNRAGFHVLDQVTGQAMFVAPAVYSPPADNDPRINGMEFHPTAGEWYAILNDGTSSAPEKYLARVNPSTFEVVIINMTHDHLAAIAWIPGSAGGLPFSDGFESGDTSAWSNTVP